MLRSVTATAGPGIPLVTMNSTREERYRKNDCVSAFYETKNTSAGWKASTPWLPTVRIPSRIVGCSCCDISGKPSTPRIALTRVITGGHHIGSASRMAFSWSTKRQHPRYRVVPSRFPLDGDRATQAQVGPIARNRGLIARKQGANRTQLHPIVRNCIQFLASTFQLSATASNCPQLHLIARKSV